MAKRNIKPRDPIVVAPLMITQLNCLQLAGIDARRFLALIARAPIPHARVGKLVCVEANVFLDGIRALAVTQTKQVEPLWVQEERQPETVDEVLALLGRRRIR